MLKPNSLRAHLEAASPWLKDRPESLTVFVSNGTMNATGAESLSFEYRYTLNVIALDYAGHPDALMVPLLAWVRRHQPDLVENAQKRERGIRFEAEHLNAQTYDLAIEIDLSERVIVKLIEPAEQDGTKRWEVTHAPEPEHVGHVTEPQEWAAVLEGEVLARWTFEARE